MKKCCKSHYGDLLLEDKRKMSTHKLKGFLSAQYEYYIREIIGLLAANHSTVQLRVLLASLLKNAKIQR